jgi:hypothetical protein
MNFARLLWRSQHRAMGDHHNFIVFVFFRLLMLLRVVLFALALSIPVSGCAVISVADTVVSTTVSVAGTVISTTASVVGSGVKAVTGGGDAPAKK